MVIAILGFIFLLNAVEVQAGSHSLRGAVVTTDGTMVPEFTVVARPIVDKPALVQRQHFKDGLFVIDGLDSSEYQIKVTSPALVGVRMEIAFPSDGPATQFRVIVLHRIRNEPRYVPANTRHRVSAKTLAAVPGKARDAYERGVKLHEEGQLYEALVAFAEAMRYHPAYIEAISDLGTVYLLLNRPDAALIFLRRAIKLDENNTIVRLNIALALLAKREFGAATDELHFILASEPRKSLPRYFLALVYAQQKQFGSAQQVLRLALDEDPELLDGWLLMLNMGLESGNIALASESLSRLREMMDNAGFTHFVDSQLTAMATLK